MSTIHDNSNFEDLDPSELHELCTRLYDEVISEQELLRLNHLLNESHAARTLYLRYVSLHSMLLTTTGKHDRIEAETLRRHVAEAAEDGDDRPEDPVVEALFNECRSGRKWSRQRRLLTWAVAVTLLMAITGSVFWDMFKANRPRVAATSGQRAKPSTQAAPDTDQFGPVAELSHVSPTTRWRQDHETFLKDALIRNGDLLALTEGEVELTYRTGTKLLLIGPAEFVVQAAGGKLRRGNLVASVTQAGHGFTIETPTGRVVDLGTEFAVTVDDFGVSEVSVFKGKVEAFPLGNRLVGRKFEVSKGRGLQWNQDDFIPLDADLRRFATSVLGQTTDSPPVDGDPRLVDRFRTTILDAQKWRTLGDVRTSTAGLQLLGNGDSSQRPYLVSAEQFDPSLGPITVTCDFRFVEGQSAGPMSFSVLTRSTDVRGIALPPWRGSLASCARCSFGSAPDSAAGVLQTGVKMESDRELTSVSWSGLQPPRPGTPYRVVIRDDGVNVAFTVSRRDQPATSRTVCFRSLFRGKANHVAWEGSRLGTTLIESVEISQDLSTTPFSSYADITRRLRNHRKQRELEQRMLADWTPEGAVPILQDDFNAELLDVSQWSYLGDVLVRDGAVLLGKPNTEGHIDTWKPRPYLLTRRQLDPRTGTLTILGRISFADNFLAGYGGSFAVMTRADNLHGRGPGWENSVLQRGVRATFWPAAWNSQHSLEIHEKPAPNTITLLATQGLQVDPQVRSYLFRVVDDSRSLTLTIVDPRQPEVLMTVSSSATSALHQGFVGFESCWGSPVTLDDVRIYQAVSPGPGIPTPANNE